LLTGLDEGLILSTEGPVPAPGCRRSIRDFFAVGRRVMADTPKAQQVSLEDFIEIATRAALRAVQAHNAEVQLNPQPLPPGAQPLRRPGGGPIIIGIIASPENLAE
jgi:hypothetical protein